MSNPFFQFKKFTVWHDKCAMKVGTDGVLLGAWTNIDRADRILDVGTGTGLVALMLAQRSDAFIVALEIDPNAAKQATENIEQSPWKDRMQVIEGDFKEYKPSVHFDVIVSNPPYFTDSLKCPDSQRKTARHNDNFTYIDLLKGVSEMLSENGRFTVIIPSDIVNKVKETANNFSLYPSQQLNIITTPGQAPKRNLLTFTFERQECQTEELLIELSRHKYSNEYIKLTKDYYLNM
ncbi:methyltransferase [Oscillospiraceae bacterium N12]|jgi:tRNA1Val (adenine37-N6)-methyltransferase|uniref:tRNA1(Val) (adenine(37)-N6)-methyltransferase n=1 Tax=Jilunia laotingensis TaxID=2763675 RepID=A0A926F9K1_9BACT|nr:methyltransferase [Jilunia laotingensis]MBC8594439.1 methyltransferase [Jilunia laotingensis]